MFDVILCEGETDAILISYYVNKMMGFEYEKNGKNRYPKINDKTNWYKNQLGHLLAICPVGGSDFQSDVKKIIKYNEMANEGESFHRIILVMDNDDETINNNIKSIGVHLKCERELKAGVWESFPYTNSFSGEMLGKIACILQPNDEYGALETFVLHALCKDDNDATEVVRQVKIFVSDFKSKKFLQHRRDKIKAQLSVSLSVMYPSRTFTTINEFLKSIEWSDYQIFQQQFKIFNELNDTSK